MLGRSIFYPAPLPQSFFRVASLRRDVARQDQRPDRLPVGCQCLVDRPLRLIQVITYQRIARQLTVIVRNGNVV